MNYEYDNYENKYIRFSCSCPKLKYLCIYFKYFTQHKTHNLFTVVENSIVQCCAAHVVHSCQQYCSVLLHLIAG